MTFTLFLLEILHVIKSDVLKMFQNLDICLFTNQKLSN